MTIYDIYEINELEVRARRTPTDLKVVEEALIYLGEKRLIEVLEEALETSLCRYNEMNSQASRNGGCRDSSGQALSRQYYLDALRERGIDGYIVAVRNDDR